MAASAAVIGTYELLELILQHLPPFDLTRAMRVSKTWHDLVQNSSTLHNSRISAPLQKLDRHHQTTISPNALGQIPIYRSPSNCAPRYNRNIFWPSGHARQFHDSIEYMGHYLNFGPEIVEYDWRLNGVLHEYATIPPCQAIALRILREEMYCVVYARDGVRVKHLRETANGMLETVGKYLGEERRMRGIVTGWIFEADVVASGQRYERCAGWPGWPGWGGVPAEILC